MKNHTLHCFARRGFWLKLLLEATFEATFESLRNLVKFFSFFGLLIQIVTEKIGTMWDISDRRANCLTVQVLCLRKKILPRHFLRGKACIWRKPVASNIAYATLRNIFCMLANFIGYNTVQLAGLLYWSKRIFNFFGT